MQVHQMRIDQIEWSSYLLGFRTNIFIEADNDIQVGDLMLLSETVKMKQVETGRNLAFKIIGIDRNVGKHDDLIIWNVALKRLKEYIIPDTYKRTLTGTKD